jgi:hypothetical protein
MARGQLETAIELLGGNGDREAAVHETRTALKRVRTLLRLGRGDLGAHTYRSENDSARYLARRLAVARDSQVMVETLEALNERFSEEMPLDQIEGLRATLVAEHQEAQQRLDGDELLLGSAITQLESALARVPGWTFARRVGPSRIRRDAHELSDLLGENHDLALLRTQTLRHRRELANPAALIALQGVIDRRRTQLEHRALRLADRLYARKPGAFVRAVERRWRKRMPAGAEPVAA